MKRQYKGGRPTDGLTRGEAVAAIAEVKEGDILIFLQHQLKEESPFRVVAAPEEGVRHVQACESNGKPIKAANVIAIRQGDLAHPEVEQWCWGAKDGNTSRKPAKKPKPTRATAKK